MTSSRDLGGHQFAENVVDTSSRFYDGTASVTTAEAVALNGGVSLKVVEVLVQADPENTGYLLVGTATSQSMKIVAGFFETIPVTDVALIYVKAASGTQRANWHARGG